jgi:hypothetical protein
MGNVFQNALRKPTARNHLIHVTVLFAAVMAVATRSGWVIPHVTNNRTISGSAMDFEIQRVNLDNQW